MKGQCLKKFKAIAYFIQMVLVGLFEWSFKIKIVLNYNYLNYHLPFHQFYTNLKILQSSLLLIKGQSPKKFTTISSVVYAAGMTKDFKPFLVILLSITPSNATPNFRPRQATMCLIGVSNSKEIHPQEDCFWFKVKLLDQCIKEEKCEENQAILRSTYLKNYLSDFLHIWYAKSYIQNT